MKSIQTVNDSVTTYIFESPDKGKTVYMREAGDYTRRVKLEEVSYQEIQQAIEDSLQNLPDEGLFPNYTDLDIYRSGMVAMAEWFEKRSKKVGKLI